jgi:hypothetical protein
MFYVPSIELGHCTNYVIGIVVLAAMFGASVAAVPIATAALQ